MGVDIPGTHNNAPPPIPGYGNSTGGNTGIFKPTSSVAGAGGNSGLPTYPLYGPIGPSPTIPGAPTTPAGNAPVYSGTNLAGLSSGLPGVKGNYGSIVDELVRAYGPGIGNALASLFKKGLFNPDVAAAFLNAQQPGINRGEATIEGAFGDAGARFSSAAALGIGDYQSQVQLNQQQTLAQLFENAQSQELSLLSGTLPTLHTEEANSHSSFLGDIVGGLEIAGGIASEVFAPGNPLGISAITGGIGTLGSANGAGGSGGSSSSSGGSGQDLGKLIQTLIAQYGAKSTQTGIGGPNDPNAGGIPVEGGGIGTPGFDPFGGSGNAQTSIDSISAGATLGATDPFAGTPNAGLPPELQQLFLMLGINPSQTGGLD